LPLAGLGDAVGGLRLPGLGLSLFTEKEWEEGYKHRIAMGADYWVKGDWNERPGVEGQVSVIHLDIEGVKMLRPDGNLDSGPYLIAGIGAYAWSVKTTEGGSSTTERVLHVGGTAGFGYRIQRRVEIELRGMASRVNPQMFAAAIQLGLTFRF
jgi:hypothetical protein